MEIERVDAPNSLKLKKKNVKRMLERYNSHFNIKINKLRGVWCYLIWNRKLKPNSNQTKFQIQYFVWFWKPNYGFDLWFELRSGGIQTKPNQITQFHVLIYILYFFIPYKLIKQIEKKYIYIVIFHISRTSVS